MNKKIFRIQEFLGVGVTFLLSLLSWNVHTLTNKSIIGVLVGAVNKSIWEMGKGLWLAYIFYALFELVTSKPYFKQFVVAKFIGLYGIVLSYIALRSLLPSDFNKTTNAVVTVLALMLGFLLSYKLTISDYPLNTLFPTACFMILLLFVLSFSFTAFPPIGMLFQDPVTGLYGIVPDYVDVGAIMLDKLYA